MNYKNLMILETGIAPIKNPFGPSDPFERRPYPGYDESISKY